MMQLLVAFFEGEPVTPGNQDLNDNIISDNLGAGDVCTICRLEAKSAGTASSRESGRADIDVYTDVGDVAGVMSYPAQGLTSTLVAKASRRHRFSCSCGWAVHVDSLLKSHILNF